jgi:predicted RNase H-like HicB family nuclease
MSNVLTIDYTNRIEGVAMPTFVAVIRPCTDTQGYYAICDTPDGGCVVQGDSIQATQRNMIDAINFHFEYNPDITDYYLSFELHHA